MAVPSLQLNSERQSDRHPLLMDRAVDFNEHEHIIDIPRSSIASTSVSHEDDHELDELSFEGRPSTSTLPPLFQNSVASPINPISRTTSLTRRNEGFTRRRSPLNSGLWISIELIVNMSQIIAAVVVLSVSRNEHPRAPLFPWVIGYTIGCIATLPHLYWRYIHRNSQISEQEPQRQNQDASQDNPSEANTYTATPAIQTSQRQGTQENVGVSRATQTSVAANPRISTLVDRFKMALDCFFAVWFVVGNVWIFGGHSSASDAPNLYRLCIVFLTFSCIGYAMPFIICAMICCCLPCIISVMGFREDMGQNRGASAESIDALPTYKFKSKQSRSREDLEINSETQGEGGILAAGTDKERNISAEDAVCCICLAKFMDNDELRELPCNHLFHMDCVDKWLKINALCPLCKSEVGKNPSSSATISGRRHNDSRVGTGT